MKKILVLIVTILLFSLCLFIPFLKEKQLNVILISVDTLRADHMGVYGYSKNTTPNIDAWAKNAQVYKNVYTPIPFTYPSISSLMTGMHPFETKIFSNVTGPFISPEVPTLAKKFKSQGYTNIAYVTNRFIGPSLTNLKAGFDEFHFFDSFGLWKRQENRVTYENLIQQAAQTIKKNKNKKQFVWIHLMDPHLPYFPPQNTRCKFNQNYCEYLSGKTIEELSDEGNQFRGCGKQTIPMDKLELFQTLYDGDVATADFLVGKILNAVRSAGLDKKSIIIIYGDHGEGFDHNYNFHHGDVLYQSAVRIPLIIKAPNIGGKNISTMLENRDFYSKILELAGLSERRFESFSFQNPFKKRYIYFSNKTATKFAVFDGRYKYIYSLKNACLFKNEAEELYDLGNDPSETTNLISHQKKRAEDLRHTLFTELAKYNLPASLEKPNIDNQENVLRDLKSIGY